MSIVEVSSLDDARLAPYSGLTEAQLRYGMSDFGELFIAESPKVINVALNAGYSPVSLLCEAKHIAGDAADIVARCGDDVPVFTGSRGVKIGRLNR